MDALATSAGAVRSCWSDGVAGARYPALTESIRAETVVVGGGIVGLTTALRLAEEGRDVAVVEAMQVGRQVTAGSTAKVTAQHGLIYSRLGPERGRVYAEANRAGMERIRQWTRELAIACDFEPKSAYLYSTSIDDIEAFEAEALAATTLGFDAELLEVAPLPFATAVALRFANQAQFNPVLYLDAIAAAFVARGGRIYEESRVRLVDGASRWRVVTDTGNVHSENVVVATNMTIKSPVGMSGRTQPRMHTAIAFRAPPNLIDGMFLGIDDPTHSLRMGRAAQGPVLVVLGPKFDTGHEADVEGRFAALERWVRERFDVGEAAWRWCNEDYDTEDRVPFAGEPDPAKSPGFFIATGFNAWGISNGTAAGMLIADLVQRKHNPWTKLYDPARPASKEFNRGGDSATIVESVEAIRPGSGGVIVRGEDRIAVWRDEAGTTHELSAACTHKGCTVTWNQATKTWDCPCHGSIFARDGSVLHGPARVSLKPAGDAA